MNFLTTCQTGCASLLHPRMLRRLAPFLVAAFFLFSGMSGFPAYGSSAQNPISALESHEADTQAVTNSVTVAGTVSQAPVTTAPAAKAFAMAVLSDLHVREENLKICRQVVEVINNMKTIAAVAILGDLVEKVGTAAEYSLAAKVVKQLRAPVLAIAGNHDFLYDDKIDKDGKKKRGTVAGKKAKLERFKRMFGQKAIRFTRKEGGHLLVFLPVDALEAKPIACLSDNSLEFLEKSLKDNPDLPTIVLTHAPLEGSFEEGDDDDDEKLPVLHAAAQPSDRIKSILHDHPQIFLWVSGHRHVKPSSRDFNAKENKVGKVTVVNVPNISPDHGWVITLSLTPELALVRTWDCDKKKFLAKHDRRFPHKVKADPDKPSVSENPDNPPVVQPPVTGTQASPATDSSQIADEMKYDLKAAWQKFVSWVKDLFSQIKKLFS